MFFIPVSFFVLKINPCNPLGERLNNNRKKQGKSTKEHP